MCYMTSKTPLDPESWVYHDYYFKNPGEQGMEYSNNHTHLQKFGGKYYLLYHAMYPQSAFGTKGGFRSICIDEAKVDESAVTIEQIKPFDPYKPVNAATAAACAGISYRQDGDKLTVISGTGDGKASWICIRRADLKEGAKYFAAEVKGRGCIELRAGDMDAAPFAVLNFDCAEQSVVYAPAENSPAGENDIFLVMSDGVEISSWQLE